MAITVTLKVSSVATSEQLAEGATALIAEGLRRKADNAPPIVTTLNLRTPDRNPDAWSGDPAFVSLTIEGNLAAAFAPGQLVQVTISPREQTT